MLDIKTYDDWNPGNWLKEVEVEMGRLEKETAGKVKNDAQSLVPIDSGTLKKEIEVTESKFKDGGWIVIAQGPGNYSKFYASFVELSTHKMTAQPYLRPALKKHKGKFTSDVNNAFKGD